MKKKIDKNNFDDRILFNWGYHDGGDRPEQRAIAAWNKHVKKEEEDNV
jgi:hypothetical protein